MQVKMLVQELFDGGEGGERGQSMGEGEVTGGRGWGEVVKGVLLLRKKKTTCQHCLPCCQETAGNKQRRNTVEEGKGEKKNGRNQNKTNKKGKSH